MSLSFLPSAYSASTTPTFPTCQKSFIALIRSGTFIPTKNPFQVFTPAAMHLCQYRWNDTEQRLKLQSDLTRSIAPSALINALRTLKPMNGPYPRTARFSCPMSQGSVDLLILREAHQSLLTEIAVQRDNCLRVILTHQNSTSYLTYLGAQKLRAELDAIVRSPKPKQLP